MSDEQSPNVVLENLRSLRSFDGEEAEFWSRFFHSVSVICKSPCVLFFVKDDGPWKAIQEYYADESLRKYRDALTATALDLAERAYQNGFAYERLEQPLPRIAIPFALTIRIDAAHAYERSVLLIITDKSNSQRFNDIVVRTQLISDIPETYYRSRPLSSTESTGMPETALVHVMDVADAIMHKNVFLLACMTLVNEITHRFNCSQVSLGFLKDKYVRTVAISHLEQFDRHSEAVKELERVYEESYEQNETVAHPRVSDIFIINRIHEEYCKRRNLSQVISIPFCANDKAAAVMTCERKDAGFSAAEIDALRLIASQVAPWLNALHYKDLWFGRRVAIKVKETLNSWLGVEHSVLKAASIVLALALLYSIIGEWDYRVEGSAALKTDAVSYVSAPYDGIIKEVGVQEGDEVKKGETLLSMETKELLLKESQSQADTVRYAREADKNRASGALADMKIAHSRMDEARAYLEKTRYQLGQAKAQSPFDGIVVEGDKQKLLGAPVSKGDILLKVAKIEGMYAQIKIGERDIGDVAQGAKGELIFLGRPWNTHRITVERVIPMAEVTQREGNVFAVKAAIGSSPEAWWRPGMSGVAKIDAGRRKIIWILTHRVIEFIRIYFWW
jgi:multidrug resistance efflux pump